MDEATYDAIERDCQRLVAAYARFIDINETDRLMALFTPDAMVQFGDRAFEGIEAVRGMYAALAQRNTGAMAHVTTNVWIEPIDADTARGGAYYSAFWGQVPAGETGPAKHAGGLIGRYSDEFRKTPDGWRFSRRTGENILAPAG